MAKKKKNRPEERPDVPELERPDARELGGTSEDSLRRAGATPSERESQEDHVQAREAGEEPEVPAHEDLTVEPSDLGRRFLEGATQQPRRDRDRSNVEREGTGEEPLTSMGEKHMRDMSPEAGDDKDRLVTHMPDRTEHEERISRKTREIQEEEPLEERRDSTI